MNEGQTLKSETDINVFGSLDELCAVKHFLGKSVEDAEALFRDDSLTYTEDLQWMGPSAFRFYIQAAINYVKGEHSTGDSCIVNCLAMILRWRLDNEPTELLPVAELLGSFCSYVLAEFNRFDARPAVYGDLPGAHSLLVSSFERLSDHNSSNI